MQNTEIRRQLAQRAFNGGLPALSDLINEIDGYEIDGVRYPSNGQTLARAMEIVQGLTDEQIAPFIITHDDQRASL